MKAAVTWRSMRTAAAASWDAEYASGRYLNEPPVGLAYDIVEAAASKDLSRGLYIGCGNGRNFVPMCEAGLDLVGLDISAQAITQLRRRRPGAARLIVGDLAALRPSARFELVIGIQAVPGRLTAGAQGYGQAESVCSGSASSGWGCSVPACSGAVPAG